jgi:DNA-binding NarL/FixJ family response regulator
MVKKGPIRIALADDEPIFRRMLVRLLEQLGYDVVCAVTNGAELIDNCRQVKIDLAIVDLDMPILDGLAAAEFVANDGIPVILVSGHSDSEYVVPEHEPIAARLCKPFSADELQRAINAALKGVMACDGRLSK